MDTQQLKQMVDSSEISDEAKLLINKLLPKANDPKVQEEILAVIRFEKESALLIADEADAYANLYNTTLDQLDNIQTMTEKQVEDVLTKLNQQLQELEGQVGTNSQAVTDQAELSQVQDQLQQMGQPAEVVPSAPVQPQQPDPTQGV